MPPPPQKRPPGVRGHQRLPALPAAQPGRPPAAPVSPLVQGDLRICTSNGCDIYVHVRTRLSAQRNLFC
eukprot:1873269-Prymnesium_polylepis.1